MNPILIGVLVFAGLVVLLAVFLVVVKVFEKPLDRSKSEVINTLCAAEQGRMDSRDWDNFVSIPIRDAALERVRNICYDELWMGYTPTEEEFDGQWFANPSARERLRSLIASLESDGPEGAVT